MILVPEREQASADERASAEIEGPFGLLGRRLAHRRVPVLESERAQIGLEEIEGEIRMNHRARLTIHRCERRPQDLVAPHDLGESARQRRSIERALDARAEEHEIRRIAGIELRQEPEPLLRERERRLLLSAGPHQRRHGVASSCALPRDQSALHQARQRGGRRRIEEAAQRQLDTEGRPEPAHGLRRKERVPAESEEAVVSADRTAILVQHLGKDTRERRLHRPARGHVNTRFEGMPSGAGRARLSSFRSPKAGKPTTLRTPQAPCTQASAVRGRRAARPRSFPVVAEDEIRHEPLIARRVLAGEDSRLAHRG